MKQLTGKGFSEEIKSFLSSKSSTSPSGILVNRESTSKLSVEQVLNLPTHRMNFVSLDVDSFFANIYVY